ncbi:MAG: hypothetical protein M1826_006357 [Phylliscum demangeonii]|nr:MAG: hypothetical protein M1826_006357 [Phylliscum demangeonii]
MLSRYLVLVVTILAGVALGAPPFEVDLVHGIKELDKFSDECSREEKFWFRTNRRTPAEAPAHEQEQAKAGPENRGTVPGEGGQHDPPGPSIHPTHFARTGGLLGQAHTFFHRLSHTLSVPHLRPMMRGGRAPVLEPVMKGMKVPIYDY